jgi:hypothetical protein
MLTYKSKEMAIKKKKKKKKKKKNILTKVMKKLHHRLQNGSGAHPASCPMGTGSPFPGGKVAAA